MERLQISNPERVNNRRLHTNPTNSYPSASHEHTDSLQNAYRHILNSTSNSNHRRSPRLSRAIPPSIEQDMLNLVARNISSNELYSTESISNDINRRINSNPTSTNDINRRINSNPTSTNDINRLINSNSNSSDHFNSFLNPPVTESSRLTSRNYQRRMAPLSTSHFNNHRQMISNVT